MPEDRPEIRLYIFDMGGVLSLNPSLGPPISRLLGIPEEEFRRGMDGLVDRLTVGSIGVEEAWREFSRRTGVPVRGDLWNRFFDPRLDEQVGRLARRLRERARVVAGTNTIEPHYRLHLERGHYELFDAVYASCRMGLAKPDPAFYRAMLASERCPPEAAVFVDDLEENVAAARELGLRAFLYRGADALIRELEAPGGPGAG